MLIELVDSVRKRQAKSESPGGEDTAGRDDAIFAAIAEVAEHCSASGVGERYHTLKRVLLQHR